MRNSVSTMVGILTAAVLLTGGAAASAAVADDGLSALPATTRSASHGGSDTGEGPNVFRASVGEGPNIVPVQSGTGEGPNVFRASVGEGPNLASGIRDASPRVTV
ncbi:hypothetical protein [Streptomyces sp. SM11]|uniref:hypothetical protein n=1 Tax=Streptomyces sp. SM11 TaxID=565557 RepID=UPI0011AFF67F|nr:hypothetical protein [Streptomyces sp. SM11]